MYGTGALHYNSPLIATRFDERIVIETSSWWIRTEGNDCSMKYQQSIQEFIQTSLVSDSQNARSLDDDLILSETLDSHDDHASLRLF